ncbi:hypothetical protein [Sporosarcina sp. E16_8]|uniref:hypothetical protein n=1 Tax=Sporosarcina sp. E16_8 TaxID=2789295 RepID=UPI001A926FDF|nr:hypothetical protein [Sporosarcina sp. E16_8]MBO0588369.1 hypothetical protein [Sporosarcina sp. E16_8]
MNIAFFKKPIGKRLFILAVLGGILLALYFKLTNFNKDNRDLSVAILEDLGTLEIETIFHVLPALVFALPFLLFILNTGDFVYSEYETKGVIVLTRLQDKRIWYWRMMFNIFKLSFFYLAILFISFIFTGILLGYSVEFTYLKEVLFLYILSLLTWTAFSVLSNVVCFITRSGLGYVSVITIYFVSLFSSAFIYDVFPTGQKWIIWFPTSQQIISWHDFSLNLGESAFRLGSYTLEFSFVYLFVLNIIIGVWLYIVIHRYESYEEG